MILCQIFHCFDRVRNGDHLPLLEKRHTWRMLTTQKPAAIANAQSILQCFYGTCEHATLIALVMVKLTRGESSGRCR
jgi:hypothetical protein